MFGSYSASKAAANAVTVVFAAELESAGIKVDAVCPGFTGTDLNFFRGTRTVEQAAREPGTPSALIGADGPTGTFSKRGRIYSMVILDSDRQILVHLLRSRPLAAARPGWTPRFQRIR